MGKTVWAVVLLMLTAAVALGVFLGHSFADRTSSPVAPAPHSSELQEARSDLARARQEIELLRAELAAGAAGGAEKPAEPAPAAGEASAETEPDTDEKQAAAKKLLPDLEYRLSADPKNPALLAEYIRIAAEAGEHDRSIKHIKGLVAKHPDDPDLRTFLGRAYLAKVETVKVPLQQGQLAFAAVGEFSKALEKDETHFDARWYRGVMNYYMPDFLNKTGESIKDLETLVDQADGGAGDDRYARVYRMLGAAYRKAGRNEDAKQTWVKGHELFPADDVLKKAAGK